ncbi:hypothetical protein VTO73DRAFT_6065 [Trametes versicolor]
MLPPPAGMNQEFAVQLPSRLVPKARLYGKYSFDGSAAIAFGPLRPLSRPSSAAHILGTCAGLQATRTHLTIRNVHYTALYTGQNTSGFTKATVIINEVRNASMTLSGTHCEVLTTNTTSSLIIPEDSLGIYPEHPQETQTIDLMSFDWTISWDEIPAMITIQRRRVTAGFAQYCLIVPNHDDFLRLVSTCASIRMLLYSGNSVT